MIIFAPHKLPYNSSLNDTHLQCPPRQIKRLLDKNLTFHKAIAWMIVVSSAVHIIAHWYNYERLLGLNAGNLQSRWPWEQRFVPQNAQPTPSPGVSPVSKVHVCMCASVLCVRERERERERER